MSKRNYSAALFAAVLVSGCASQPGEVSQAANACANGARSVEVLDRGRIARVLGTRESRSGLHEGFLLDVGTRRVLVEDNAGITGPIPLRAGEEIVLQGLYECNDGVIHWTHHDPSGRHAGGFIEADGRTYR